MNKVHRSSGFTLVELVAVIVLLGILSVTALPRFLDLNSSAKIGVLQGIEGSMKSTINMVRVKAYAQGISPTTSNPGNQANFLIDFGHGTAEIDWRNLCPESRAELGDQLTMIDFIQLDDNGKFAAPVITNQYTLVGYDIPSSSPPPTNQGCYIIYDSFGSPDCTVTVVTNDC